MKPYAVGMVFLFSTFVLAAQSRDDVKVFVTPVSGGTPEQQMFFAENFRMELLGANYAVVDNQADSDYVMNLGVVQEVESGSEEGAAAEGITSVLTVSLKDSNDGREILRFSWAFETLEEMYEWNLHLIYQAMANVPLTKLTGVVDTSQWRNKWIYIRASFDYPITFYANPTPPQYTMKNPSIDSSGHQYWDTTKLDHKVLPFPGLTVGAEFQFLNFMSVEGGFQISFGDPISTSLIPSINVELKFPLKPSRHFMIEPYAATVFPAFTASGILQFPKMGFGGGVQFGVKGGSMGAFFVDVNYIYYLGDVVTGNPDYPDNSNVRSISWNRFSVGLGLGYKIGFVNRNKAGS
jgi:hypothetical protein